MTEPSATFAQLGLPEALCRTLSGLGYEQPSSIQQKGIGPLLEGRDLLGVAQTGTGKTAAFSLPLLANLSGDKKSPQCLILTPTRELCIQVADAIESYAENLPRTKILAVYGGQDMRTQLRALNAGAQIVVGTPGRVMDHMRRGSLDISNLKSLVLDEADEMLRMGFIDDVEWILSHTPDSRQLALFSATMPPTIKRIASKYLNDPAEVRIEASARTVSSIEQFYLEVNNAKKPLALDLVLETEDFDGVIVFARTKVSAQELSQQLEAKGYRAAAIHGDLNQRQRELCIRQLRESVIDVVVATDVAARGIDVARITHVVNYDVPYDGESYVHRIGRTGRAGRSGRAFLFVTPRERRMLRTIERASGQPVTLMQMPTADQVSEARARRYVAEVKSTLAVLEESNKADALRKIIAEVSEKSELSMDEICLALTHMYAKGRPLNVTQRDLGLSNQNKSMGTKGQDLKRDERPRKTRSERANERENIPMQTYQMAVGRSHAIRVGDILGAVANELDIDSRYIGNIQLDEDVSRIELPADMPKELFQVFRKLRIRNYPAQPEMVKGSVDGGERRPRKFAKGSGGPSGGKSKERKPRKEGGYINDRRGSAGPRGDGEEGVGHTPKKRKKSAGKFSGEGKPRSSKPSDEKRSRGNTSENKSSGGEAKPKRDYKGPKPRKRSD